MRGTWYIYNWHPGSRAIWKTVFQVDWQRKTSLIGSQSVPYQLDPPSTWKAGLKKFTGTTSLHDWANFMVSQSVSYLETQLHRVSILLLSRYLIIGIKHGFSYISIRQVPWEVLKTEAEGRGFQHLPRDLANVNAFAIIAWKLKTFATFRVISCTILFRLFTDVSRTKFPLTMLLLGPGSTHLITAANLWPRYDHIENCVAVH